MMLVMNGERAKKRSRVDVQWWGKRPMSGTFLSFNRGMSKQKRLLHKIERRNGKNERVIECSGLGA